MKDEKQLVVFVVRWMILIRLCAAIDNGWLGLLLGTLGTALMAMYAYYEDRLEKAQKRERRRVTKFADGRASAYENKEVFK